MKADWMRRLLADRPHPLRQRQKRGNSNETCGGENALGTASAMRRAGVSRCWSRRTEAARTEGCEFMEAPAMRVSAVLAGVSSRAHGRDS